MGFRISNIHAYDRFIAIDLGSYRVRSALYHMNDGKLQREGFASIRQNKKNILDGVIMDMQGVSQTIEKSIHEACRGIDKIPDEIIIGFSPVVCIGDTITSQYLRHDPAEPLTMDELDIMIEKIEKTSLLRVKSKAKSEFAIIHDDIRLISSTITSIVIDGNNIPNPIGTTGQHVKISVLNIYTLASEYNILRSIVSSLGKNVISIVPNPIILPKITEKNNDQAQNDSSHAIYIDIGYTHMTIVSLENNEIRYFETFSSGAKMFIDILQRSSLNASFTEIESLIMRMKPNETEKHVREEGANEYFSYVIDTIISVLQKEKDTFQGKTIYVSGGLFSSKWIENLFFSYLEGITGGHVTKCHLSSVLSDRESSEEALITTGLSFLGQELLHVKKDPIIRILRYTLYHYE